MNIIKLVSGGVDSTIMAKSYEGKNVYVDFGQKYARFEKEALHRLGIVFDEIKISSAFKDDKIYIPDRNLMMATLITTIYNPDIIMIAGLKDDRCIDKNEEAFERMSSIISRFTDHTVKVMSPYFNLTKGEIVYNFPNKAILSDTFSCYNPSADGKPCGNCPACLRKAVALETNGIGCGFDVSEEIITEYLHKIHTYDQDRISRFLIYLKSRKPVYAIDIDGVLCEDRGSYSNRKPIKTAIDRLKDMDGYIVLYTARLEIDRLTTEKWLSDNMVSYDCLIMNKIPYSLIVDDKCRKDI